MCCQSFSGCTDPAKRLIRILKHRRTLLSSIFSVLQLRGFQNSSHHVVVGTLSHKAMPSLPILLLDGGLGTCLESAPYNAEFTSDTPLWSSHFLISSPETLLKVYEAYAAAGADVLLTATYQASLEGFAATPRKASPMIRSGKGQNDGNTIGCSGEETGKQIYHEREAAELMRSAVPPARKAFTSTATLGKVALSLGAYGATMRSSTEYSGDYVPDEMKNTDGLARWHERRLRIFRDDTTAWGDVDFVAFETLPVIGEVRAVRQVMGRCNTGFDQKNWWVSCVFPNDDLKLPDGSTVEELIKVMLGGGPRDGQQPWGIGINCTSIKKLKALVLRFGAAVNRILRGPPGESPNRELTWPWLVIYPDGAQGLVYNTTSRTSDTAKPDRKAQTTSSWAEEVAEIATCAGQRGLWQGILVGGCCKSTPEDIAGLRTRLLNINLQNQ